MSMQRTIVTVFLIGATTMRCALHAWIVYYSMTAVQEKWDWYVTHIIIICTCIDIHCEHVPINIVYYHMDNYNTFIIQVHYNTHRDRLCYKMKPKTAWVPQWYQ